MAHLDCLRRIRARLPVGLDRSRDARADAAFPDQRDGPEGHGRAGAALERRALPPLPGPHERFRTLVSQEDRAMNATVAADAPPSFSMRLLERNVVPDKLIRRGIRKLLEQRLEEENVGNPEAQQRRLMDLIARLKASPIAVDTIDANR